MFNHKASGMKVELATTALAFTDLHNDFLSPDGKAYPLIEETLKEQHGGKYRTPSARCERRRDERLPLASLLLSA